MNESLGQIVQVPAVLFTGQWFYIQIANRRIWSGRIGWQEVVLRRATVVSCFPISLAVFIAANICLTRGRRDTVRFYHLSTRQWKGPSALHILSFGSLADGNLIYSSTVWSPMFGLSFVSATHLVLWNRAPSKFCVWHSRTQKRFRTYHVPSVSPQRSKRLARSTSFARISSLRLEKQKRKQSRQRINQQRCRFPIRLRSPEFSTWRFLYQGGVALLHLQSWC